MGVVPRSRGLVPYRRLLAASLCLLTMSVACSAVARQPVRIALVRSVASAPLYIAIQNGAFAAESLDARLDFVASDALATAAVANGDDDIAMTNLTPAFFNYAAMHRLKLLASQVSEQTGFPGHVLLVDKKAYADGLRSIRDLRHRKIGIISAEPSVRYAFSRIAEQYRIGMANTKIVAFRTASGAVAAMSSGLIDAAALPYIDVARRAEKLGGAAVLRLGDAVEWQEGGVVASAQTIESHRPLVEKFMRAYLRGTVDYDITFLQRDDEGTMLPGQNYGTYLEMIADRTGVAPALLQLVLPYCDRLGRLDAGDVKRQIAFWQGKGLVGRQVSSANLFDFSFADAIDP